MLAMDADAQKANLHNYLKHERAAVLAKLDGLSEYPLILVGAGALGEPSGRRSARSRCRRFPDAGTRGARPSPIA